MLTHALPPNGGVHARLNAATEQLRSIYQHAYTPALAEANSALSRFESPDGTDRIDPVDIADTVACRAVNRQLNAIMQQHFPGVERIDNIEEPAVIDSLWHHPATATTVAVQWDHAQPYSDPTGLTLTEALR